MPPPPPPPQADKNAVEQLSKEQSDLVEQVGFKFFHVLFRMIDLDKSKKKVTRESENSVEEILNER